MTVATARVRLETGQFKPVGLIKIPKVEINLDTFPRVYTYCFEKESTPGNVYLYEIPIILTKKRPYGVVARAHSKDCARLKQHGQVLPYEELYQDKVIDMRTPRPTVAHFNGA